MGATVKDFKQAICLGIEHSDTQDTRSCQRYGSNSELLRSDIRRYDRFATFIAVMTGALMDAEPELAAEVSAFLDRVTAGEQKATTSAEE